MIIKMDFFFFYFIKPPNPLQPTTFTGFRPITLTNQKLKTKPTQNFSVFSCCCFCCCSPPPPILRAASSGHSELPTIIFFFFFNNSISSSPPADQQMIKYTHSQLLLNTSFSIYIFSVIAFCSIYYPPPFPNSKYKHTDTDFKFFIFKTLTLTKNRCRLLFCCYPPFAVFLTLTFSL